MVRKESEDGRDPRATGLGHGQRSAGDRIFEVKSTYILQPGPASLTEGVRQMHARLAAVHGLAVDPSLAPERATP